MMVMGFLVFFFDVYIIKKQKQDKAMVEGSEACEFLIKPAGRFGNTTWVIINSLGLGYFRSFNFILLLKVKS